MKYYLSIGCIFKNEAINMKEWLDHYINRGVEHFYMINDDSSDNFLELLTPYIDNDLVTLYNNDISKIPNRQILSYDKFLIPSMSNSNWFLICDMDEFIYSPVSLTIPSIIKQYEDYNTLYSNWLNFNSNNNIIHPKSIVESCIKRMDINQIIYAPTPNGWEHQNSSSRKYIIQSRLNIPSSLGVHDPNYIGKSLNISFNSGINELHINHYLTQSREFWEKIKMKRGDVNNWHSDEARDWDYFNALDVGIIIDERLKKQNEYYGL